MPERYHWLDAAVQESLASVREAAQAAASSLLQSKVRLGAVHTAPTEQLTAFLSMSPQLREHMREQLGDETYDAWVQRQMQTMARKKGVGPAGAAALFEMLGVFERPAAVETAADLTAAQEPVETEDELESEAAPDDGEPELVL